MDAKTQEKAINGAIALWEDIYFVQGKGAMARQIKPLIQEAFREPGSFIHRFMEVAPDKAEWYIRYANYSSPGFRGKIKRITGISIGQRRKIIGQNLTKKSHQQLARLFKHGMYTLAVVCHNMGISAAEAERRINQQYENALSDITLKELVKADDSATYENEIRNIMNKLGLSTGSVAGSDKRLSAILSHRFKTFIPFIDKKMSLYEQDLKAAMWECAKGNHHLQYETLKMIEGDPPRPLEEQIALIVRIFRCQEPKLMRNTLLRIMRKTIADLPDVSEQLQEKRRAYHKAQRLEAEEIRLQGANAVRDIFLAPSRNAVMTDNNTEEANKPAELRDGLRLLKPRELDLYYGELQRMEAGMTREEYYKSTKQAEKVKQKMKYLTKKYGR